MNTNKNIEDILKTVEAKNGNINLAKRAIELLENDGYRPTISRVERLSDFLSKNKNVTLRENNSWSTPPKPSKLQSYELIGGTTYKYQIWAVTYK